MEAGEIVLLNHSSYSHDFLQRLRQFREDGLFTDVTIKIGESLFQAHKLVLAGFSEYFRNTFENESEEKITIEIENVNTNTLKSLLEYAYTGQIEISTENVQELLVVTKQLGMYGLQERCEDFAASFVDLDNCVDVLKFSKKNGLKILEGKTLEVFPNNIQFLEKLDLNPEQLLDMFDVEVDFLSNGLPLSVEEREIVLLEQVVKSIIKNPDLCSSLSDFLQKMHLPSISREKAQEIIKNIPNINENQVVTHLMDLASMYRNGRDVPEIPPYWTKKLQQGEWKITHSRLYSKETYLKGPIDFFDYSSMSPNNSIRRIMIYLRQWDSIHVIGGMRVKYDDGNVVTFGLQYDSPFVTKRCDVKLEDREWIIGVKVDSGWVIDNLIFTTNKGRTFGPFSSTGRGGRSDCKVEEGLYNHLHSFYGNVIFHQNSVTIRQIGFTWAVYKPNL